MSGRIETFETSPAVEIDAVAELSAILAKLNPVTALAGTFVNADPSPLKDPVKEPDNSANSVLSEVSSIFTLPLLPLFIFILLLNLIYSYVYIFIYIYLFRYSCT